MHWCPRHTPRIGISPASCVDHCKADPDSSGRPGPGDMTIASGRSDADALHVDCVVAVDDRLGAELAQLLDEVVDERVVVVDEQHSGPHRSPMLRPGYLRASPGLSILVGHGERKAGTRRSVAKGPIDRPGDDPGDQQATGGERPLYASDPPQLQAEPALDGPSDPLGLRPRRARDHPELRRGASRTTAPAGTWPAASSPWSAGLGLATQYR